MSVLAQEGPVYQAGTLSGNPVAMAAGYETLKQLGEPGVYELLEERSNRFLSRLEKIVEGKGIQVNHVGHDVHDVLQRPACPQFPRYQEK